MSFPNLIHSAPSADPVAFTAVLFEFLAKRQGILISQARHMAVTVIVEQNSVSRFENHIKRRFRGATDLTEAACLDYFGQFRLSGLGAPLMSPLGQKRKSRPCGGMSALPRILLQKSFWGGERKFLEPLMRFTRGEVRDHIVSSKIDHGPP